MLVGAFERGVGHDLVRGLVDGQLHAAPLELLDGPGQERGRGLPVHEQRLGRVAHAGPLALGVDDDGQRPCPGRRPRRRTRGSCRRRRRSPAPCCSRRRKSLSSSPPRGMTRSTVPLCCTSSASTSRPPARNDTASRRQAGLEDGALDDLGEDAVGVLGGAAAAQDDGIARLEAEGGRVDGDVGPGLVDDGDHAERHAHPAHVEPVGQPPAARRPGRPGRAAPDGLDARLDLRAGGPRRAAAGRPGRPAAGRGGPARRPRRSRAGSRPRGAAAPRPRRKRFVLVGAREQRQVARRAARRLADGGHAHVRLPVDQHQTVAVHDLLVEMRHQAASLGGAQAGDAAQVAGAHGRHEPPGDLAATAGAHDRDGVAGGERAVDRRDPDGQQAAPRSASARAAPASTSSVPRTGLA